MLDVPEAGILGGELLANTLVLRMLRCQDQRWVVTQLPQVLQCLHNMHNVNAKTATK